MSIRSLCLLIGCGLLIGGAAAAPSADARQVLAELRVEGPSGALDPGTWYVTGSEQIRRSRAGDACIRDQGRLSFAGPTALGLPQTGSEHRRALRQVRVRLDEAGPFMCEIGSISGRSFDDPAGFSGWTYWHNLVAGSSSADLATLRPGDQVLWVFGDFGSAMTNTGDALELLGVPARAPEGQFEVEVVAHGFDGSEAPAEGVTIAGASGSTPLGGGRYSVTVPQGRTTLTATRGTDIPSNHVATCFEQDPQSCPSAHGRRIFGSERGDRLKGTAGWDRISSGRGDDRIDLRKGGRDRADCGPGDDAVLLRGADEDDQLEPNCERVRGR